VDTRIGTGRDTGTWYGSTKADVDAAATALLAFAGEPVTFVEATSAALAALTLP
jgi:hypothetical protein